MDNDPAFYEYWPGTNQPYQNHQNASPYAHAHHFGQPQIPFTSAEYQTQAAPSYATVAPYVFEGFVPAVEDFDDNYFVAEEVRPNSPVTRYDRLVPDFASNQVGVDETDSGSEEDIFGEADDLALAAAAQVSDADPDYSRSEAEEEGRDSQDDIMFEERNTELPKVKRGRGGARGGTRGRPPGRGRGRGGGRGRGRGRPRSSGRNPEGRPRHTADNNHVLPTLRRRGRRAAADPGPEFKSKQRKANEAFMLKKYDDAIKNATEAIQSNPEIFATHSLLSEIHMEMGNEQRSIEALLVGAPTKRDAQLYFHIIDRVWAVDQARYPKYTRQEKIDEVLKCLRQILILEPKNYEARYQKLYIEIELGNVSTALRLCRTLLELRPGDVEILREMAQQATRFSSICKAQLPKVLTSFDRSIAHLIAETSPQSSNFDWSLLNYYLELVERAKDYEKALHQLKRVARWLLGRRTETFWEKLNDDREWDTGHEPRRVEVPEFSVGSFPKSCYGAGMPLELRVKMGVYRLRMGPSELNEALWHFNLLEPETQSPQAKVMDYGDLYREVADTFKALGYHREAVRFYEPLRKNTREMTVRCYLNLFGCYTALQRVGEASACLRIAMDSDIRNVEDLVALAKLLEENNDLEAAMRRAKEAWKLGGGRQLRESGFRHHLLVELSFTDPTRPKRSYKPRREPRLWRPAIRPLAMAPPPTTGPQEVRLDHNGPTTSTLRPLDSAPFKRSFVTEPIRVNNRRTIEERLQAAAKEQPNELQAARQKDRWIRASFESLKHDESGVEAGNAAAMSSWMKAAAEMLQEFVQFKMFFFDKFERFTSYFKRMGDCHYQSTLTALATYANSLEAGVQDPEKGIQEIPDQFHAIPFNSWLDMFCSYAILLARQSDKKGCFDILSKPRETNIFAHRRECMYQVEICRLACAIALDDSPEVCHATRNLIREHPFSSDPFRLYSIANRLCTQHIDYNTTLATKSFLRYVKAMDFALLDPEDRKWWRFTTSDRSNWLMRVFSDGLLEHIKGHDPVILSTYAHVLMAGGTYIAALNYYFRAFTIIPEDPLLNLSIGLAYIQHANKRQSENRQYQLQQGLAFVSRYYDLRTKDNIPVQVQEAEFNVGRVWHALGLTHLAISAYEKCIRLSPRVREEHAKMTTGVMKGVEDFAAEAAFGIQTILAIGGDWKGAMGATEEVLVIQ